MKNRPDIIFEDENIIVIYKPAGLPVQTASVAKEDVCSILKNHLKGGYLGVVHRLDQPVEGLLVFSKNARTSAYLTEELSHGSLKKSYRAVSYGECGEGGTDTCFMKKTGEGFCEIGEGDDYKKAVLSYTPLWSGDGITLFSIEIETGRFHQIRAQMAHLGFPLLGDMKYGSKESKEFSNDKGIKFPALCADKLSVELPGSKTVKEFTVTPENPAFDLCR